MLRDREARHRERRMSSLQAEAHDAQVRALRYQVDPHFLYNTLRETMNGIEERLDPDMFIRVHRSALVRANALRQRSVTDDRSIASNRAAAADEMDRKAERV